MATRPYWLTFGASAVSGLNPTFIQFRTTAGITQAPPAITEPGSFGMYLFNYAATTNIAFVCDGATSGLAFTDRYIKGVLDPDDLFSYSLAAMGVSQSAIGVSLAAVGASIAAMGSTFAGFGVSQDAMGVSIAAMGVSQTAMGVSLAAIGVSLGAMSVTMQAIGSTLTGIGTTLTGYGVSLYALGNTNAALIGDTSSSFGTDISDPTTVFGFLKRAEETREGNETYVKASGVMTISSRGSSQLLATKTIAETTTQVTKT